MPSADDRPALAAAKTLVAQQLIERTAYMRDEKAADHSPVYLMAAYATPPLLACLNPQELRLAEKSLRNRMIMESRCVRAVEFLFWNFYLLCSLDGGDSVAKMKVGSSGESADEFETYLAQLAAESAHELACTSATNAKTLTKNNLVSFLK